MVRWMPSKICIIGRAIDRRFFPELSRNLVHVILAALLALVPVVGFDESLRASEGQCARTAHLRIYSNASFIEEAGDVVGYELAMQRPKGTSIGALLYFYEGVPNEEGLSLLGQISGQKLTMEGDWTMHLIEEPSKKEVVETQHVSLDGTLDSTWFRGTIKIKGMVTPTSVQLKRVSRIWTCGR
jgi:hypothetical protein